MPRKKRSSFGGSGTGAGTGDFFLCFTSRPSKRSPLSPGRAGAAPSLSSSLSRRLRSSGSLRGAQSPMFPSGRRKGPAFDAPVEPSSPKVTCIGQVRVKSKKTNKKNKPHAVAISAGSTRESSFREKRNRKTSSGVCERIWGCRFEVNWNYLFSCCGGERREKMGDFGAGDGSSGVCEGLVASWVGEEGVERELEVVIKERVSRREVVEVEVEVSERSEVVGSGDGDGEEEEARVSICIPPRNALLLMRCRSDPVRMAALSSRLWDLGETNGRVEEEVMEVGNDDVGEEVEGEVREEEVGVDQMECVDRDCFDVDLGEEGTDGLLGEGVLDGHELSENIVEGEEKGNGNSDVKEGSFVDSSEIEGMMELEDKGEDEGDEVAKGESVELEKKTKEMRNDMNLLDRREEEEEIKMRRSSSCSSTDIREGRRSFKWHMKFRESGRRRSLSSNDKKDKQRHSFSVEKEPRRSSFSSDMEGRRSSFCIERSRSERSRSRRRWSFCLESEDLRLEKIAFKEEQKLKEKDEKETSLDKGSEEAIEVQNFTAKEEGIIMAVVEDKKEETVKAEKMDSLANSQPGFEKEAEQNGGLPDCLLLMMYEPKLSMEVSKETWVCSTDFVRWHPNQPQYRPCQLSVGGKVIDQGGRKSDPEESKEEANIKDDEDGKNGFSENKQLNAPVQPAAKPPPPPPRPVPIALVVEKKMKGNAEMVPALPCGPLVLTRCKSEPMRSSERLIPDACFWKDRHRPIGATGIGF